MQIDKKNTASFDVDPQKGFTPICPDELPVPGGDEIAGALNEQAKYATFRVVSKDAHPSDAIWIANDINPQFTPIEGRNVDIRWKSHCVPGTIGFDLLDDLPDESKYDMVVLKGQEVDKHPYGACYHDLHDEESTGVIEYLKNAGVDNVICGGLALDYCVKTTALQLSKAGFKVIVNLSSCRAIADDTAEAAVEEMKSAGVIIIENINELTLV